MESRPHPHQLPPQALELVASRFRLLGEANRLRLLMALEEGEKSVSQLAEATGCSHANVSRHLQILSGGGILGRRREGLNVYYFIADDSIFTLCDTVCGSLRGRLDEQSRALGREGKTGSGPVSEGNGT